ncbi:MAG TPA: RagB/SusD family nutrient uptake outer membrane protein, partial [Chitinophagaceae bacterium]|nr:RagB/SusD family nutrient uptake outer membrane protein [Chitinophagaceae bacterium]
KVADVYAQVIKDLTDAEAKIPAKNGFYASKVSAAALAARVYLQKGDYANAVQAANRAITTGIANGFAMKTVYADAFPNNVSANTTEDIFAMQVTTSSGNNSFQTFFSANSRGDIQVNPAHTALYETGDARLNLFYTSGGSKYTGKFDYLYGNVHIIRLAEMYLVRAEANFRLGTATGDSPLNDINLVIRARVKLPPLTAGQLTLAAILKERKLELAFEGASIHDIKRTQGAVGALPWNSPKLIYPIPIREIRANPNLSQNTGYF